MVDRATRLRSLADLAGTESAAAARRAVRASRGQRPLPEGLLLGDLVTVRADVPAVIDITDAALASRRRPVSRQQLDDTLRRLRSLVNADSGL